MLIVRPDGRKKAYVRLAADHDALEVANKVCPHFMSKLYLKFANIQIGFI